MSDDDMKMGSMVIPKFDPEKIPLSRWTRKMNASIGLKKTGYKLRLQPNPDLPASYDAVIDETTEQGKKEARALQENEMGMNAITLALVKDGDMTIAEESATDEWPNGLMHVTLQKLYEKYQPQDIMTETQMRMSLSEISMGDGADPTDLFDEISTIQSRFVGRPGTSSSTSTGGNKRLSRSEEIALVMTKAPEEYTPVLVSELRRKGNNCTMDDLQKAMNDMYRVRRNGSGGGQEVGLAAFKGKCNECGKFGHKRVDCWNLEENASKRPRGWKRRYGNERGNGNGEVGGAAIRETTVEFLL